MGSSGTTSGKNLAQNLNLGSYLKFRGQIWGTFHLYFWRQNLGLRHESQRQILGPNTPPPTSYNGNASPGKENKKADSSGGLTSIAHSNQAQKLLSTSQNPPGTVTKRADSPRSYGIKTLTKNIRQNRENLLPLESSSKPPAPKKSPEMNISSRLCRTVKPSLKSLENMATL